MTMWKIRMSPKGQITLPKEFRKDVGLLPGDEIMVMRVGDEWLLRPKTLGIADIADFLGPPPNGTATLDEIDDAILKAAGDNAMDFDSDDRTDDAA